MSALSTPFRIALLISVCLNLLLAAALAGLLWRHPPMDSTGGGAALSRSLPDPQRLERSLAPERRAMAQEILRAQRREMMASVRALRSARAEVQRALTAEQFESAKLAAALAEVRAREQATAELAHAGLLRLVEQLQPAERGLIAEGIRHHRRHGSRAERRPRDEPHSEP